MDQHEHSLEQCRALIAEINAYLDGDLPADLCADLQTHLADCPDCRVVFDSLNQTVQLVRSLAHDPPTLPAAVEARLLARLGLTA